MRFRTSGATLQHVRLSIATSRGSPAYVRLSRSSTKDSSLLKKQMCDPISASRTRLLLAYLSEKLLRHNIRFAHVSLHRRRDFWLRHNIRFAHVNLRRRRDFWLRHNIRFAHVSLRRRRDFWLRHNIRFAHVSLRRNSPSSFSRRSLRGSCTWISFYTAPCTQVARYAFFNKLLVLRSSGRSLNFGGEYLFGVDGIKYVLPSTEFAGDFDVVAFGQDRPDFLPAKQAKHCSHPVART